MASPFFEEQFRSASTETACPAHMTDRGRPRLIGLQAFNDDSVSMENDRRNA